MIRPGPVVVVGAGVIGLATAYAIRRRGRDVVVVDRGEPGAGCSAGNAGWICPSLAAPLPAPGLTATALRWMLRRDSPLYVAPGAVLGLAPWLFQFWRRCNAGDHARGLAATIAFARGAQAAFDRLLEEGVGFEVHRNGILFAFRDEKYLREELAAHEIFRQFGYGPPEVLSGAELEAREPSLAPGLAGGFTVREEYYVRPETLTAGYADRLRALGVEIRSDSEVLSIAASTGRATGVETAGGSIAAAAVVIAAGARSGLLLGSVGFSVPITAGTGYSITVDDPRFRLGRGVSLGGLKVVCTPFDGGTRFGGTMELSGVNERLDRRRLESIRRGVGAYFRAPLEPGIGAEWVGMRPVTPDGLPLIGPVPRFDNLFVASGHSMLGVTMAPSTGDAIAGLIEGEPAPLLGPFAPARFA